MGACDYVFFMHARRKVGVKGLISSKGYENLPLRALATFTPVMKNLGVIFTPVTRNLGVTFTPVTRNLGVMSLLSPVKSGFDFTPV